MASFKLGLQLLIVSVFAFHLLPSPVLCSDEKESGLLYDINTYRKNLSLPILDLSKKASCLAEEIASDLDDKLCEVYTKYFPVTGGNIKLPSFQKSVKKCKINIETTRDGVILPVCVHNLDPTAVLSNYTQSINYTQYLNSSQYTIGGVGSEDNWMVLVIGTHTASGEFSSATSLLVGAWKGRFLVFTLFVTALMFLIN